MTSNYNNKYVRKGAKAVETRKKQQIIIKKRRLESRDCIIQGGRLQMYVAMLDFIDSVHSTGRAKGNERLGSEECRAVRVV